MIKKDFEREGFKFVFDSDNYCTVTNSDGKIVYHGKVSDWLSEIDIFNDLKYFGYLRE